MALACQKLIKTKKKGVKATHRGNGVKGKTSKSNSRKHTEALYKAEAQPHVEHEMRINERSQGGKRPRGASNLTIGVHRSHAVRAPTRRAGRVVGVGMRLPTHHNKISGPVAKHAVILNMRVHRRTCHTETRFPVGGRVGRIPGS